MAESSPEDPELAAAPDRDCEPVTVALLRDGGEVRIAPIRLVVLEGPAAGATHTARGDRVVVGTHESGDVVLPDPTVSRFHCELMIEGSRVAIRDLGSRNGTWVDGVSVLHAHLRSGAVLTLGRTRLRFELGPEPVPLSLSARQSFGSLVGSSLAMRGVFALLERAAASDATILLEGETGTGKEAAAESIHAASRRAKGPLVIVDCGAIPPSLLESELFGHERGAFTGAVGSREGAFEAAAGGTVFLDEIGELPIELQPRLLRALERREVKRIGRTRYDTVDVRVIAATNRDLRGEVNARRFRSDLYYRLAVLMVRLPPLRERAEDLPLLVDKLLDQLGASALPEAEPLREPSWRGEMARHQWPGNVRELRNYLERSVALAGPAPIEAVDASREPTVDGGQPLRAARESWTRDFERRYLADLLARHGDNVSAAARSAGVDRKYLYRLLWRNGLR